MSRASHVRMEVDERRAQLIARGIELFSARPYDEVGIEELARGLGISKGLLYHYFPTKREFYRAAIEAASFQLIERVVVDPALAPLDRLRMGLRNYLMYVNEHGKAYLALMRGGVGSDPGMAEVIETTRQRFLDRIVEGMGVSKPEPRMRLSLRAWMGFVEAASLDWVAHHDVPIDDVVEIATGLFPVVLQVGSAVVAR